MERLKRLEYMAAEMIFYYVLNTSYIFTYSSWYYCQCSKFQGYAFPNGEEFYCFICQFQIDYYATDIEKIFDQKIFDQKKNSRYNHFYERRFEKCIDFGINPFWNYHFKFSWRDNEGKQHSCYLKGNYFW